MRRFSVVFGQAALAAILSVAVGAQPSPAQEPAADERVELLPETPVFSVTTVAKTAKAVSYRQRAGATKIDFRGTSLLPRSHGEAKVEGKKGYIEIEVEFRNLEPAVKFGAEYLTYVMWAITPEGRSVNLGEILLDGRGRGKLNVTSDLQVFGLVVTAEPYFSVGQPSDLIVMENEVRKDTKGRTEVIDAKFELLQRGQYAKLANPLSLSLNLKDVPLELYEARNAVEIVRSLGAEDYAAETFDKAKKSLETAESMLKRGARHKDIATPARRAVQIAEDSRVLTVKRQEQERLEQERAEAAAREEEARLRAEEEAARRAEAEAQQKMEAELRAKAESAADDAERRKIEAELAAARAEAEMQKALREKDEARRMIEQAQAERERAIALMQEARQAQAMLEQAKSEADAAAREARQEAETLARLKAEAEALAEQAISEREALRNRMQEALSKVVDTKESARGLILNLPDILFDFGKSTLRGEAREVLSRVSGILMVTPGYNLSVEGHTDSVGSDEFNQKLSEDRASSVSEYLGKSGVSQEIITTTGFGETQPMASNDDEAGRQKNRRVEIVIQDSGEFAEASSESL